MHSLSSMSVVSTPSAPGYSPILLLSPSQWFCVRHQHWTFIVKSSVLAQTFLILIISLILKNTDLPPLPRTVALLWFWDAIFRFCPNLTIGPLLFLHWLLWVPYSCIQMTTGREAGKEMTGKCSKKQNNSKISNVTEAKEWASFRKDMGVNRVKW